MSAKRENEQYIHNPSAPLTKYVMNKLKKLEKTGQIMVNSAMEEEEMFADEENDSGSDSDSESGIFGHQNMCHEVMQAESILNESSDDDSRTSDNNVTEMDTSNDADTANSTIQCSSSESRDCTLDEDEESCSEDSCDQASNAIDPSYTNSGEFDRPYDVSDARDDGLYSSDEEFDCNAEFRRFGYVDNTFDAKVAEKKLFEVIETHNTLSPACVLRLVLQFSFSNDVCFSGIVSLAHLMNVVVGQRMLPDTRYLFDRMCGAHPPHILHAVCPNCSSYVGEFMEEVLATCSRCSLQVDLSHRSKSCFFAIVDPSDAVRDYIQTYQDYYDYVVKERVHDPKHMRDMYDSKLYRDFVAKLPLHYRYCYVTACFNVDGIAVYVCSAYSIWVIYIMINELPPQVRLKSPIVVGIWVGKGKPNMQVFLDKFVAFHNDLTEKGIECIVNGEKRILRLYLLIAPVDTMARFPMNATVQFSSEYGCDWCFQKGIQFAGSNRYPYEDNPRPMQRNDKKYLVCAKKAMETGSPCLGVRYLSPLINLYFFKMTDGLCPEYMHQYLAGCGKQITKCILKTLKPAARSLIDEYMKKIRVPTQLGRFARPLSSKALYKCLSKCWNTRVTLKAQQL
ncbi:hypothetical protein QAD02_017588 [Eretmocerus hayati]|uniref:Uncharacterized protein n=1 Tax=Eretmocerus hayati TaxID=131215 RepID=A0ACC2PFJ7_9HYME|nr:hypothetical protein QAD02_017588 [Eretmocerus hayati]